MVLFFSFFIYGGISTNIRTRMINQIIQVGYWGKHSFTLLIDSMISEHHIDSVQLDFCTHFLWIILHFFCTYIISSSLSLSLCVFQHVFVKRFLGISHQWPFLVESQSWEIRITVELCFLIKGIYHIHLLRSHI